ncbi:MAG TPA: hypothetical protein VFT45_00125 [Longimicrobium sp.]|nr:hypothetical protein [Longimicrobium sp.]
MTRIRLLKRALYVVPVIGAMAFGTTQVFASSTAQEARACTPKQCLLTCGPAGGVCSSSGVCICR